MRMVRGGTRRHGPEYRDGVIASRLKASVGVVWRANGTSPRIYAWYRRCLDEIGLSMSRHSLSMPNSVQKDGIIDAP